MTTDLSLYELETRVLISMIRERLHDDFEKSEVERLSVPQLYRRLRELMREETVRIPAGTPVVECRWCKENICWVRGRFPKVRESIVVEVRPTKKSDGEGYAHIADCPKSGLMWHETFPAGRTSALLPLDPVPATAGNS